MQTHIGRAKRPQQWYFHCWVFELIESSDWDCDEG